MRTLSVVCARAGSKGLKNKCIRTIAGKMVIEYSIEYSLSLGDNVKTVVSTDIKEAINYCKTNNINYIDRDSDFCRDNSRLNDAMADSIEKFGDDCEYASIVYGNMPIRYPALFHDAVNFIGENNSDNYDAIISMQNVGKYHPEWMFDYNEEQLPQSGTKVYRRQMLSQKMIHDGHTFIFNAEKFIKKYKGLIPFDKTQLYGSFGDKLKPLVNESLIIDIDSGRDLEIAEAIINNFN